ncbi:hypothetical protein PROFUN_07808 [Planoprotostelium fungivorum]|uniref:Protein LTV1 homolog n=1 Tax=Planoprotostelium fungivorum TaxID=1890364 RepID=A0A2P6MXB7_9EUKA|nr:hypothetical protein PROFUN_07808 [Planoprotostelium fungivorum]
MPKKFIDKKEALTFKLVHRSQRDINYISEEGDVSPWVLEPKIETVRMSITSSFRYLTTDKERDYQKAERIIPSLPEEVFASEESVVPQTDVRELFFEADEDIVQALEGESEEEEAWEEIDDDFVSQANKGNFDYGPSTRTVRFGDEMEEDEEDDDDYGEDNKFRVEVKRSTKGQSAQRKIFEETFETMVKKYDDQFIGELDEETGRKEGGIKLEDMEDVFDEYLAKENSDRHTIKGKENEYGLDPDTDQFESGEEDEELDAPIDPSDPNVDVTSVKSRRSVKTFGTKSTSRPTAVWDMCIQKYLNEEYLEKEERERKAAVALEEEDEEEKWDCQSVVKNHPGIIIEKTNRKIVLSNKSGLPVGVLPQKPKRVVEEEEEEDRENKGTKRDKEETKEDKKNRKKQIKEERAKSRLQKKALKEAFKSEQSQQQSQITPTTGIEAQVWIALGVVPHLVSAVVVP